MSNPARVMTGLGSWFSAVLVYVLAVWLTMGKPTEEHLASPAGHLRYELAPMVLFVLAFGLLVLGFVLFGIAIYVKLTRRG